MGFHHTAFAPRDLQATHNFYTESMGFELAKVVAAPSPEGGWAKHVFYETGKDEFIAFWELHDMNVPATWSPALSKGQGLPPWVNHLAFRAHSLEDLEQRKQRWLEHGHMVAEIDHGWCKSIYTEDPNGTLVEFCTTTSPLGAADREEAMRLLTDPQPPLETPPPAEFHMPKKKR